MLLFVLVKLLLVLVKLLLVVFILSCNAFDNAVIADCLSTILS